MANAMVSRAALGVLVRVLDYSVIAARICAIGLVVLRLNPFSEGPFSDDAYYLYWLSAASAITVVLVAGMLVQSLAGFRMGSIASAMTPLMLPLVVLLTAYPHSATLQSFIWLALVATLPGAVVAVSRITGQPVARRVRMKHRPSSTNTNNAPDEQTDEAVVAYPAVRPRVAMSDIVGMEGLKERLTDAGQEVMASTKGDARNGILLFGEPGNGKTMFAEAVASELRLPFINVSFGNVVSKWIGETTENVMMVFAAARAQAPCVLFLDEIDSLIRDRSASGAGGSAEEAKTTNTLLTEIVKLRQCGVVLIAATNFLDQLDQAAIREGRFDFKVEVTPPDQPARAAILSRAITQGKSLTISDEAIEVAVRRWDGFSAARIRAIGIQASRSARRNGLRQLTFDDLMEALRTVQGRAGRLPEGTLSLDELTLPKLLAGQLKGLAARMIHISEIEAKGAQVPQGVLFAGEPGTGKTATARALAKSTGWAFLSVAGNELLADPGRIDVLVREARDIRPTIVFIDEADDVLADRTFARHSASITNRLLTAMDGAAGKAKDVMWVAATNHPDQLDPAAVRGGRFTVKLQFEVPDEDTLQSYISGWLAKSPAHFTVGADQIASVLAGLSIANVSAVLQHAVDEAVTAEFLEAHTDREEGVALDDVRRALAVVV